MKRTVLNIKNLPKEKTTIALAKAVHHALEEMKAVNILYINVKDISSVTDVMVIASGTSTRHVKSISDTVVELCKKQGFKIIGVEGQDSCEWVLVDLGDILVHVMQENTRKFYELEKLWDHQELKSATNNEINSETKNEIEAQIKKKIKRPETKTTNSKAPGKVGNKADKKTTKKAVPKETLKASSKTRGKVKSGISTKKKPGSKNKAE